jgi:hypothetical protein
VNDRAEAERRARRLVRWYSKAWRRRYGEEFTELLIADIVERPRSWRRTSDVALRGLAARSQPRSAVAGCVLAATFGVCAWIIVTWMAARSHPEIACGTHCTPELIAHIRATWTWRQTVLRDGAQAIPLAVGVGLAGTALALLLHRPRLIRR